MTLPRELRLQSTSLCLMPWQKRVLELKAAETDSSLSAVIRGLLNAECARLVGESDRADAFDGLFANEN